MSLKRIAPSVHITEKGRPFSVPQDVTLLELDNLTRESVGGYRCLIFWHEMIEDILDHGHCDLESLVFLRIIALFELGNLAGELVL